MDNSPKKKEEALCDYLLCEYLENPPQPQNWNEPEEAPPPDDIFLSRIDRELAQQTKRKIGTPRKYLQPAAAVVLVLLLALSVTAVAQNWNIYNFLVSYSKHGVSVSNGAPQSGLIFHSDRGVQYASNAFGQRLAQLHFRQSMSRKDDPYDNAVAENFFSCLKCELIHLHHYDTRSAAQNAVFSYIEAFYNSVRPHSALAWLSPRAFQFSLLNHRVA